jgi:chlorite dismutase
MSDPSVPGLPLLPTAPDATQTIEGHFVIHDVYGIMWPYWLAQPQGERDAIVAELVAWLQNEAGVGQLNTALYNLVGQKGDLLLLHYRSNLDGISHTGRSWQRLRFYNYLRPTYSFLSMIEVSLYEATMVAQRKVNEKGIHLDAPNYQSAYEQELAVQRKVMESRVFRFIPDQRYLCFYTMNRRRGEQVNWYTLAMEDRRNYMRGLGRVVHRYHREVTQVIGGAIGLDDWEWGISLHANDPLVFKKLITEMRFDPGSALYAEFGPIYVGLRQQPGDLPALLG